ncbi:hypothetical protein IAT40_003934 [Kwoniella sp. CBS 6097]
MPIYDFDEPLSLPIEPSSPSLHSHLAALNILSLRLASLTSSTTHPVRIPLTSKASIKGAVIHTNDVKVNLGGASGSGDGGAIDSARGAGEHEHEQGQGHGGWWVDMTASEASDYVRRRKRNLLEHHARLTEGPIPAVWSSRYTTVGNAGTDSKQGESEATSSHDAITIEGSTPSIGLHPLFYSTSPAPKNGQTTAGDGLDQKSNARDEPEKTDQMSVPLPSSEKSSTSHVPVLNAKAQPGTGLATGSQKGKGRAQPSDTADIPQAQVLTATIPSPAPAISLSGNKETSPASQDTSSPRASAPAKSVSEPNTQGASLVEILDDEDEGSAAQVGPGDDTTLNEEGLPFHEIRETLDGETIGPAPPASTPADQASTTIREEKDDYDTPEAIARRAALRRKLFGGEGSDSDSDGEEERGVNDGVTPTQAAQGPIHAKGGIIRASSTKTQKPSSPPPPPTISPPDSADSSAELASVSSSSSISRPQSALANRRSSSSMPPPSKSILKPPTRKKSVSFDPSIPPPPESPDKGPTASASNKIGFDLPWANAGDEEEVYGQPRPVPVISTPQPTKRNVEEKGFAGFKKGFLAGPPRVRPYQDDQSLPSTSTSTSAPSTVAASNTGSPVSEAVRSIVKEAAPPRTATKTADSVPPTPIPTPRKPSLFAQRLSQPEIDASAPHINTTSSIRTPSLPRASETKSTNTVKPSVVEKPPTALTPARVDVKPIVERPPAVRKVITDKSSVGKDNKAVGSGEKRADQPASSTNKAKDVRGNKADEGEAHDDDEEEEYEDDDDELEDFSSGEEDEYDLDEALLAREVALEYHRRQAYQPLNRDPNDLPDEEGDQAGAGEGGVMLGLPRISDLDPQGQGPLIINPTPDDLRRFVRVGRLENGNLVLAPGEEGLPADSDDDDDEQDEQVTRTGEGAGPGSRGAGSSEPRNLTPEEEEKAQRKRNREAIKRKLMGLDVPVEHLASTAGRRGKGVDRAEEEWKSSLPPSLAPASTSTAAQGEVKVDDGGKKPETETDLDTTAVAVGSAVRESTPSPASSGAASQVQRGPSPSSTSIVSAVAGPKQTQSQEEAPPAKAKKVSRFKAARMAGN